MIRKLLELLELTLSVLRWLILKEFSRNAYLVSLRNLNFIKIVFAFVYIFIKLICMVIFHFLLIMIIYRVDYF